MSQPGDVSSYYMPYDSGEETDVDTDMDTEEEKESDTEDIRIRREEDPRYAIHAAAGPNFDTYEEQLKYSKDPMAGQYNVNTNISSYKGLKYMNAPKTTVTSLFSMKSNNRDKSVYPSPFLFKIKTPRVYKNVTKFQLVQISFPNNNTTVGSPSTFVCSIVAALLGLGVDPCCLSTCVAQTEVTTGSNSIAMIEQNRTNLMGDPMLVTLSVPTGQYTNDQLARELTEQSNNTPPFNIISYEEFKDAFQQTRDISILFNEPGDLFQSNVNNKRFYHVSKDLIMNTYYSQQHIDSFITITDKIAFNAYYYPVLKELIATQKAEPFLQVAPYSYADIVEKVMGQFQGLQSDLYYLICQQNRGTLDQFRHYRTFRYKNINKYQWSWNEVNRNFSCLNSQLHPSIQRDIQGCLSKCLENELSYHKLNTFSYKTLKNDYYAANAIFKHLESNLSTILAGYHLVSGYEYKGGEIHSTLESTFHFDQLNDDSTFCNMFQYTSIFGNQHFNLPGCKFTFSTFIDYHSTISSYYHNIVEMNSTITGIHESAYQRHHQYVMKKYRGILPEEMIQQKTYHNTQGVPFAFVEARQMYVPGESIQLQTLSQPVQSEGSAFLSDPTKVPYDIYGANPYQANGDPCSPSTCSTACAVAVKKLVASWYGCLPVNTTIATLNYRLGLNQLDLDNYSFTQRLLSTLSTNADYLMQINDEQGFNNMDIAMDENYRITNETTGQVKLMAAKILTGGLGSGEISQTVIQNPLLFENYLGKLDKLSFKIYYNDNTLTPAWEAVPFGDLIFNEWEATFQIEEAIGYADRNSGFGEAPTIPIPDDPSASNYLYFTSPDNPNSK